MSPSGLCSWRGVTCHPRGGDRLGTYYGDFCVVTLNLPIANIHRVMQREVFTGLGRMRAQGPSLNGLEGNIDGGSCEGWETSKVSASDARLIFARPTLRPLFARGVLSPPPSSLSVPGLTILLRMSSTSRNERMEELGKPKEMDLGRLRTMYEERTKKIKRSNEEDQ